MRVLPTVRHSTSPHNGQLGQISAHAPAEAIGGKGNVIMFTHDPHPGVRPCRPLLLNLPNILISNYREAHTSARPLDFARSLMQGLLTAHPMMATSLAFGLAGRTCNGRSPAIEAAKRTGILVVGIDGTDLPEQILKVDPSSPLLPRILTAWQNNWSISSPPNSTAKPREQSATIGGVLITKENAIKRDWGLSNHSILISEPNIQTGWSFRP